MGCPNNCGAVIPITKIVANKKQLRKNPQLLPYLDY